MLKTIVAAASVIAFAGAAPAFAQYGGSPDLQIDGDYSPVGDDHGRDKLAFDEDRQDEEWGGKDDWGAADQAGAYPDEGYIEEYEAAQDYPEEADAGERWQGEDGRSYCRRADGTTGLVVGAGAGALVGRGFDTRDERGTGTILGAIAGALLGRAVERGATCR